MLSRYGRTWKRFAHDWNASLSSRPQEMMAAFLAVQGTTWLGLYTTISFAGITFPPVLAAGWVCARFSRKLRQPLNIFMAAGLQRVAPSLSELKISPLISGFAADENTKKELNDRRLKFEEQFPSSKVVIQNISRGATWLGGSIDQYGLAFFLSGKASFLMTMGLTGTLINYGVDVESIIASWGGSDSFGDGVGNLAASASANVVFVPLHFYTAVYGVRRMEQFAKAASPHIRAGWIEGQQAKEGSQKREDPPSEEEIQNIALKSMMMGLLLYSFAVSFLALTSVPVSTTGLAQVPELVEQEEDD